jgi:hypothetical protein
MIKQATAITGIIFSLTTHAATTSCPASYSIDVGPVLDCEIGSQRRFSMVTNGYQVE